MARAELKALQPHDFRRSFATLAVNAGVDIYQIKDLLGHSSVAVTRVFMLICVKTRSAMPANWWPKHWKKHGQERSTSSINFLALGTRHIEDGKFDSTEVVLQKQSPSMFDQEGLCFLYGLCSNDWALPQKHLTTFKLWFYHSR